MPARNAKVIINPVAGGGSVRRRWQQIYFQLQKAGLSFDYEFSKEQGHATEIARQAADANYRYLIAVGGDGTVNEVVNGILGSANSGETILGVISAGTAGSFSRSLGIVQDYVGYCSTTANQNTILVDIGVVKCWKQGRYAQRFFVNEASVGLGASITNSWHNLPKLFGRGINYRMRAIASYSALVTHRNTRIRLHVGNKIDNFRACYIVVANGPYFAGGMRIAPCARLDDALLDLVIIGDVSKLELLRIVPTAYEGNHVRYPKIRQEKVTDVMIESDKPLLVEADGEIMGDTPAAFSVLPSALNVLV